MTTIIGPFAASDMVASVIDRGDSSSPEPAMAVDRASPASRQQPVQAQGDKEEEEEERDEDDDDDSLFRCSPSRHAGRRRNPQNLHVFDRQPLPLVDQRRPATSRSHFWPRQRCRSRSPSSSKHLRPSSNGLPDNNGPSSTSMTKEEFEALPPTIQRKYFSNVERLRFAQNAGAAGDPETSSDASDDLLDQSQSLPSLHGEDVCRPPLKTRFASDPLISTPHHRRRVHSSSARLYTNPPDKLNDKLQRRPLEGGEKHPPTSHSHHKSVILDAADEAVVKIGKRQQPPPPSPLPKPNNNLQASPAMHSLADDETLRSPELKATADSLYESFRWLEEGDDLDLRLCFDDYNLNAQGEGRKKGRGLLFRRHLSISKLAFGRGSTDTASRSGTEDTPASPTLNGSSMSSLPGPPGHARRRSRALSLMSPNKTPMPDVSTVIDSAASHYQDPEARMKLRVYLASPHKFDEAIEFGFPSMYEVQGKDSAVHARSFSHQESSSNLPKLHTSIDDELASMCSDPMSPTDPSSPRTPESMEQSSLMRPLHLGQDSAMPTKFDYVHAPASSREMTLRMTLTRPDLRSNEEQIYGWQKSSSSGRVHTRDGPPTPLPYIRGTTSKDNIERQFAAMDQENLTNDNGVVKRFWNRVRRS